MFKCFDFECQKCGETFEGLVEGTEGQPEECPRCSSTAGFTKVLSAVALAKKMVPTYPGSKRLKAGYQHTHNRAAEKSGRQVSMHGAYKDKD